MLCQLPRALGRVKCVAALATALAVAASGCLRPGGARSARPTQSDRLIQAYPELRAGRFALLADFENPTHMEIVQQVSVSEHARCALGTRRLGPDTGRACLELAAGSPDDTVVLSNRNAQSWFLKRDWRGGDTYDLLLLGVESPRHGLSLELSIAAGPPRDRRAVYTSHPLERGWNLLRLDLAELGERLPLDDIQELRLSAAGLSQPATLRFDDLILTGARRTLLGDPAGTDGGLYVQEVGRRWRVGAGGRFELVFANGQIVGWYNLAADPNRLRNLVQGTALGPTPVVVEPSGGDFQALGAQVVARPQLLELNPVRAVIAGEWRFADEPGAPAERAPLQRWRYTIYRTGQIYVTVEATRVAAKWAADRLGVAVSLRADREDELFVRQVGSPAGSGTAVPAPFALGRREEADAALLFALRAPRTEGTTPPVARLFEHFDAELRRATVTGVIDAEPTDVERWTCHLVVGGAAAISDEDAAARARTYADPLPLKFELGSPLGGGRGAGGFDDAGGCYVVAADQGRARFTIDGSGSPVFSPCFEVTGAAGNEAWVYVNHLVFEPTTRTDSGRLLFQLPDTIRGRTLVEVYFRR